MTRNLHLLHLPWAEVLQQQQLPHQLQHWGVARGGVWGCCIIVLHCIGASSLYIHTKSFFLDLSSPPPNNSAARAVHSFLTLKPPPQQQPPSPTTLTSEGSLGARHRMRDGMHRAQQHMKLHKRGSTDVSGAHEDEEEEEEYDDEDEDEGGGGGGGKKHGGVGGERNGSEQQRKRDRLMRTLRDDSQSPLNVHRHHEHVRVGGGGWGGGL